MTLGNLMALASLVASLVLVVQVTPRLFPGVALAASAVETLVALRVIRLSVSHVNLTLVLAVALAVSGLGAWTKTGAKAAVTAATVTTLVGAIQLAGILL